MGAVKKGINGIWEQEDIDNLEWVRQHVMSCFGRGVGCSDLEAVKWALHTVRTALAANMVTEANGDGE